MKRLLLYTAALVLLNLVLLIPGWSRARRAPPTGVLKVGLVFDVGGRGDKSFNDSAYRGVERAVRELAVYTETIEPGDGSDRESGIRLLAEKGFDLIVGVGVIFSDDLHALAQEYPGTRFACVDYAKFDKRGLVVPPANLVGLKFREEEGAFLVGALAALVSKSGVLGFVGGMDRPLIHKFQVGYTAGAAEVCPTCKVLVGYAGVTGDAFKNPAKGKELALAQYAAGADVVFHAAGSTGLGVFEAARQRERFAIGVDADQWSEAPGRVLTSMTKQVDESVFQLAHDLQAGRWSGGVRNLGLREGGVDYIFDANNRAFISDAVRTQVEALRRRIIAGDIAVPSSREEK